MPNRGEYADHVRRRLEAKRREEQSRPVESAGAENDGTTARPVPAAGPDRRGETRGSGPEGFEQHGNRYTPLRTLGDPADWCIRAYKEAVRIRLESETEAAEMKWTLKARLAHRIGRVVGKRIKKSIETDAEQETVMEPLKISTVAAKGGKGLAIGSIAALLMGALAGLGWLPIDDETQKAVAAEIDKLVGAVILAYGAAAAIWNVVKNIKKTKDGVALKCIFVLVGTSVLFASGCTITGPRGTYSLAVNAEQIGVMKDLATQAANIAQEIREKQAALEEAEKSGQSERAQSILEKLVALRDQFEKVRSKAIAKTEATGEALTTADATIAEAAQ